MLKFTSTYQNDDDVYGTVLVCPQDVVMVKGDNRGSILFLRGLAEMACVKEPVAVVEEALLVAITNP